MSRIPTVAVCIPTYNQVQYLPAAILSACCQTYEGVEVWVADDASTDATPSVLDELCQKYPQIRQYRQPKNCGIAANNTWLLAQPQTDYIVRLDSDDILDVEYVAKLLPHLEKYPAAGYGHVAIQEIDADDVLGRKRHLGRITGYIDADTALLASLSNYRVAANIVMFRRSVLHELDFYNGRPEFVEDYDLSVRIADAGYGNVYIDEILAQYRIWVDAGSKRLRRKHLQLVGYDRIYSESMVPAFARRGWDLSAIKRQRQRMALRHSTYCFSNFFSATDREELVRLLLALDDSPALRLKLLTLRLGFKPMIEFVERIAYKGKSVAKSTIMGFRAMQQPHPSGLDGSGTAT